MFSFTEGFYPSEWFAFGCLTVLILSTIGLFITGSIAKIKQKKGEETSKGLSIAMVTVLILFGISASYIAFLSFGRISFIIVFAGFGLIKKFKPNMNSFLQLLIGILIGILLYSPILIVLGLDSVVKEIKYEEKQAAYEQMAQRVSQTKVTDDLTLDDIVLSYEDVNETYWSAHYYDYDNTWKITVNAKHKPEDDYEREEIISIKFMYTEEDNKLTLEEIEIYDRNTEERDYTTYSQSESQKIFDKMIEEAIN